MLLSLNSRRGTNPKTKNFNKLTNLLFEQGYNEHTICRNLHISPRQYISYFMQPKSFRLTQLELICFMCMRPMPYIVNLCLEINKKSVNWFDEESKDIDRTISEIKNKQLKDK